MIFSVDTYSTYAPIIGGIITLVAVIVAFFGLRESHKASAQKKESLKEKIQRELTENGVPDSKAASLAERLLKISREQTGQRS